ncbi:MAG: polysaccharide pyruvyl transferase family protein [Oscillospiraceae bacterium]
MKVGIVTIYDNMNMGNRLQNYALQEILLKYADEVVTIKNKPRPESFKDKLVRASFLAESVLANKILGKKRKAKFLEFNKKYINVSNKCCFFDDKSFDSNVPECDLYCAGSDQIWNPTIGRAGYFNYLGFTPKDKNFSFSASFGIDSIPDEYKKAVKRGLENMKYISVREDAGKIISEDLTGRNDVQVIIDPTMYFSAKDWAKAEEKPEFLSDENYILTYFLGGISKTRCDEIQRVANENGWKVINILDKQSPYYNSGPSDFVYLIHHAKLVCTDSFHASVFSFLFDTPLSIFKRDGSLLNMNSRLETLVEKFSLEKCVVENDKIDSSIFNVDYSKGKETLASERKKADSYLDKVFNGEKQ